MNREMLLSKTPITQATVSSILSAKLLYWEIGVLDVLSFNTLT
jgi:hypothetical protein